MDGKSEDKLATTTASLLGDRTTGDPGAEMVGRLRSDYRFLRGDDYWRQLYADRRDAADLIERLTAERADMLAALHMFVSWQDNTHDTAPAAQHDAAMNAARATGPQS